MLRHRIFISAVSLLAALPLTSCMLGNLRNLDGSLKNDVALNGLLNQVNSVISSSENEPGVISMNGTNTDDLLPDLSGLDGEINGLQGILDSLPSASISQDIVPDMNNLGQQINELQGILGSLKP